jgi:hypothetical protein
MGRPVSSSALLMSAGLSSDAPVFVPAQLKAEIVANRISATTTSRTVEREIAEVMALSPIPEAAMRVILERLCRLFETVARIRSAWLPEDVRITEIRQLCARGNHRQHFHILRDLLPPLRSLLERLVAAHNTSDPLLLQLNQSGVLNALHVIDVVANAHEHLTEEILSPPTELRRLWKPVAVERRAPGGLRWYNARSLYTTPLEQRAACQKCPQSSCVRGRNPVSFWSIRLNGNTWQLYAAVRLWGPQVQTRGRQSDRP